jgi:hypothetical protein
MATIVGAALSSHAYTFQPPETWDARRAQTRKNFARRYGREAPECPEVATESLEDDVARYERISTGLATVRERFDALRPDVLVILGDDQDENYHDDNLPQLAVFTGPSFVALDTKTATTARYENDVELARHIMNFGVERGFDLSSTAKFTDDRLISHAHCEPIAYLQSAGRYRVLPVFVNGIHVPAPTPRRCYEFGTLLRAAIEAAPGQQRVVIYASGGMSHYSAGFPWPHYAGSNTIGSVSTEFDRGVMSAIRSGDGASTVELSSKDLLDNGDVEMRQTIVLAGIMGDAKPMFLEYEPFHRGIMGMAVGYWEAVKPGMETADA